MDIIFSFAGLYILVKLTDHFLSAKGYRGVPSDHFNGKIFYSYGRDPEGELTRGKKWSLFKWIFQRPRSNWRWRKNSHVPQIAERIYGPELVVTFINHASVLIQTEGLNILTDPIWSMRASPFSFAGPRRFREAGVQLSDIPHIDVVLISHNHYDHMDIPTLKKIEAKWNPKIIVGLGNAEYLLSRNIKNCKELDWWETCHLNESVSVEGAPGQHFSSRAFSDRNNTLWMGFVIRTPHGDMYFAGDTGYGEFVHRIQERYPKGFRLGLLPIGAYKPEWFMGPVHISPDEAVQIARELKIWTTIGIHFGTFHLADDLQDEPVERIQTLIKEGLVERKFLTLENGDSIAIE